MKRLLAEWSLSTMHGLRLKVHRILAIFLFTVGMAAPLLIPNLAGAQTYKNQNDCDQEIIVGCMARHQHSQTGGLFYRCGPSCIQCYFIDNYIVGVLYDPEQYCLPIYKNVESNKVSETQSEHSCKEKGSIIDIDNQVCRRRSGHSRYTFSPHVFQRSRLRESQ